MNGVGQEITSSGLFKKNVYNENDPSMLMMIGVV